MKKKKKKVEKKPTKTLKNKAPTKKAKKAYPLMVEVAYEFVDQRWGKFEIRKSANAWWMSQKKLGDLVTAIKMGLNDMESCYYAGITKGQKDYFLHEHPEFFEFFDALPMHPRTVAKITIHKNLNQPEMARWFAEHRMGEEFKRHLKTDSTIRGDEDTDGLSDEALKERVKEALGELEDLD